MKSKRETTASRGSRAPAGAERAAAHGAEPAIVATVNAGSSSIKFAVFRAGAPLARVVEGSIDRIGLAESTLTIADCASGATEKRPIDAPDHVACLPHIREALRGHLGGAQVLGVGHRIVHGGSRYSEPQRVTPELLEALHELAPYDPEHLPAEIGLIETISEQRADLAQVVCFDTAFHRDMPRVAKLLAIPRRFQSAGLMRYGFHGLSYAYLMEELARLAPAEARGRVILAHLGNGASMAAVRDGRPVDTTMGFTPSSGLVMGTRSGDLDPGIVRYLSRTAGIDVERFHEMVNAHSGLLGLSETSPDMRDLLARERSDERAADAVSLFCYRARAAIGSLAAALGGLDTLVFAGGIGERAPAIRERICAGLGFLGVELDQARNDADQPLISSDAARVRVRRIVTDEASQIARCVYRVLGVERERRADGIVHTA